MEDKRVKKEKTKFKKFLLIYTIILVLLMTAFLIYVADSLIQYEKNQKENYIQNTIEELKKGKIKDSDISKYAYKWATGIDITFISAHQLLSPTFTNQKTENYEIYSENAFSCEIYLEKNMKVNGKTMQDKMHERMYFVYDKENSGWKLVNMQSITENK